MKYKGLLFLLLGGFYACSTPSQIVSSWRDPNTTINNPGIHKIVVGALLHDQGMRREVEDYMASLYPGVATPSYQVLGKDTLFENEDAYNQKLKDQGYDGIVLLRQTSENVSQHYVPGQFPSYYQTWGGYWHHGWGVTYYNPGTPGRIATDRTWRVQATVYSIEANKLIWSGNTSTTDPGGRFPLFKDVCDAVYKEMKSEGFLNTSNKANSKIAKK